MAPQFTATKGRVAPGREIVQGLGRHFLAGARFAPDEHGHVQRSHLAQLLHNRLETAPGPDHAHLVQPRQPLAQRAVVPVNLVLEAFQFPVLEPGVDKDAQRGSHRVDDREHGGRDDAPRLEVEGGAAVQFVVVGQPVGVEGVARVSVGARAVSVQGARG